MAASDAFEKRIRLGLICIFGVRFCLTGLILNVIERGKAVMKKTRELLVSNIIINGS